MCRGDIGHRRRTTNLAKTDFVAGGHTKGFGPDKRRRRKLRLRGLHHGTDPFARGGRCLPFVGEEPLKAVQAVGHGRCSLVRVKRYSKGTAALSGRAKSAKYVHEAAGEGNAMEEWSISIKVCVGRRLCVRRSCQGKRELGPVNHCSKLKNVDRWVAGFSTRWPDEWCSRRDQTNRSTVARADQACMSLESSERRSGESAAARCH